MASLSMPARSDFCCFHIIAQVTPPFWWPCRTGVQYFLNVGDNFYPQVLRFWHTHLVYLQGLILKTTAATCHRLGVRYAENLRPNRQLSFSIPFSNFIIWILWISQSFEVPIGTQVPKQWLQSQRTWDDLTAALQGMNTGCGSPMDQIKEATKVQFTKAENADFNTSAKLRKHVENM